MQQLTAADCAVANSFRWAFYFTVKAKKDDGEIVATHVYCFNKSLSGTAGSEGDNQLHQTLASEYCN